MEKQWLPYAFVHILKLGRFGGNCKFCLKIRHSSGLYKYTTGFCGSCTSSTFCSFSGENEEKLLKPSNDLADISEQQGDLKKVNTYVRTHSGSSVQQQVLYTTQHSRRDNNDQLSYQSQTTKTIFKPLESKRIKCVMKLLQRAYKNLKDNQLLSEEHKRDITTQTLAHTVKKASYLQETASLPTHDDNVGFSDRMLPSEILKHSSRIFDSILAKDISNDSYSPTAKDNFNSIMYLKYQYPPPGQAKKLSAMFPDPEKLVDSVIKFMMRTDGNCAQRLVVTDHLKQHYWKAHLTLSWCKEVTVLGIHPERDLAILGSYLHMCEHLKNIGLIYENEDGAWVPMTCDKVTTMLEKLSKYGESSLGCPRGRGFKIILEQIKDRDGDRAKVSNDQESSISKANITAEDVEKKHFGGYVKEKADTKLHQEDSESVQEGRDMWSLEHNSVCKNTTSSVPQIAMENHEDVNIPNTCVRHTVKPRWLCTVHVGWPFPFSVQATGLSLPAAQTMGYMSAIYKLKLSKLLTDNNSALSSTNIAEIVLNTTKQIWRKNSRQLTYCKTEVDKFGADAQIFCDASNNGFGAFLTLTSTQKVSWLSEEWNGHRIKIHLQRFNKSYLHSMLGELYTLVTAIFTWKHKLRSQRLLCYCDNLTVVSVANSFASEPALRDPCKEPIDNLIHILQSTCQEYNITLQVMWLDREQNQLADCLARRDFLTFQAAIPKAAINKTKAKKLVIKGGSLL